MPFRNEEHRLSVAQEVEHLLIMTRSPRRTAQAIKKKHILKIDEATELVASVMSAWKNDMEARGKDSIGLRAEYSAVMTVIFQRALQANNFRAAIDAATWRARFDGLDVGHTIKVNAEVNHRHIVDMSQVPKQLLMDHAVRLGLERALGKEDDIIDVEVVQNSDLPVAPDKDES